MSALTIQTRVVRKKFVLDVDARLPLDGVTALFGRSGCGKTTLLRVIAGLDRVPGTQVKFGETTWQDGRTFVPLHRRRIGMVFQEHSLLPHLSVRGNMLYGYKRTPPEQRRLDLDETTRLLDMADLLDRPIDQLSGGQRRRVALGRAILSSPELLLLDEPLAGLDTQARREIMPYFSRLAREAGVPVLLVSHAHDEIERLADHVALMHSGRITAVATLQEILAHPQSPLFEESGPVSVLEGQMLSPDAHGRRQFQAGDVRLWTSAPADGIAAPTRLRILARDVALALDDPARTSVRNHLPVTITAIQPPDASGNVTVTCRLGPDQVVLSQITAWSREQLGLEEGMAVYALIKSVALLD